jgi:hypothetical protein
MFWKKKSPPTERIVMVDLWYHDDMFPNVLQSWTWQTVDTAPDYPRAFAWIDAMGKVSKIHHFQIKEFERPVPNFNPNQVLPISCTSH